MNHTITREVAISQFVELGLALGVQTITWEGQLGLIEGSLKDATVFRYYLYHNIWNQKLQEILLNKLFLYSQGTYIDVGANIGLTVIPVAEKRKIRCYAFEPEPGNYHLLQRNIKLHQLETLITTYPVALYSKRTQLSFELSPHNHGDHRVRLEKDKYSDPHSIPISVQGEDTREIIHVQAERLDDILASTHFESPLVIKVDIQGAEVQFFEGAVTLLKDADYLIIEFWPYALRRLGSTPETFLNVISQFPFGVVIDDFNYEADHSPALQFIPMQTLLTNLMEKINFRDVHCTDHVDIICSKHQYFPTTQIQSTQQQESMGSSSPTTQKEQYIYPPHKPTEEILVEKAISLCNEGTHLINEGKYLKALERFDEGMYLYPRIRHLQYMRAECLAKLGRTSEAELAARAELTVQPEFSPAVELLKTLSSSLSSSTSLHIDEPIVYLVSYPRSGNTLLRSQLSSLLQTQWYSVHQNDGILFDPRTYIPDWNKIVVVKDHDFREEYRNVIYVVRDGRDAVISLAYMTYLLKMHPFTRCEQLGDFLKFLKENYPYGFWAEHVKRALGMAQQRHVLFVKYEELTTDPSYQLKAIAQFLNKELTTTDVHQALQTAQKQYKVIQTSSEFSDWGFTHTPSPENTLFYALSQNRGHSNWRDIFDQRAKSLFHEYGGTEILLKFGYETDAHWWKK